MVREGRSRTTDMRLLGHPCTISVAGNGRVLQGLVDTGSGHKLIRYSTTMKLICVINEDEQFHLCKESLGLPFVS